MFISSKHVCFPNNQNSVLEFTVACMQVGTDVALEGLFERMPVRRTDWEKRSGVELANALTHFALLAPPIRFLLYHTVSRCALS